MIRLLSACMGLLLPAAAAAWERAVVRNQQQWSWTCVILQRCDVSVCSWVDLVSASNLLPALGTLGMHCLSLHSGGRIRHACCASDMAANVGTCALAILISARTRMHVQHAADEVCLG
jgi:hypothetical protein